MKIISEYDYYNQMKEDIISELKEYGHTVEDLKEDRFFSDALETFWNSDAVTGSASGSYFCNSFKAMEMIFNNYDLLSDAVDSDFISVESVGLSVIQGDFEYLDVIVRQSLLNYVLSELRENGGENL